MQYYFHPAYHFRVDIYKYFLKLLLHLEDENNFSRYSCVILDIDLQNSSWASRKPGDDKRPTSQKEELEQIIKKLKDNKVTLRDEHYSIDSNGNKKVKLQDFYKNAGYYLYLYLLQKGMPADRICMLTANGGDVDINDDGKTSGKQSTAKKWKGIFNDAGLIAPKDYDRKEIESKIKQNKDGNNSFKSWLDGKFSDKYLFRSCVVAMSGCLLEMIDKNDIKLRKIWTKEKSEKKVEAILEYFKHILKNIRKFPLRVSNGMEHEYANIIWQLVNPWEANLEVGQYQTYDYAYYNLLKTTRNCLAHDHKLKNEFNLQITAFLFGLSLRGLFDFVNIDESVKDKDVYKEYIRWEKEELLKLLSNQEINIPNIREKDFPEIIFESFKDINNRVNNLNNDYSFDKNIPLLIKDSLGRKEKIKTTDLLRSFLHGINPIHICKPKTEEMYKYNYYKEYEFKVDKIENLEVKLEVNLNSPTQKSEEDKIEYEIGMEYLKRVRKTLQKSIENKK